MAQCRDLENHHHEKLLEIAINTLEKSAKGEMDEDLPEDVRAVSSEGRAGCCGQVRALWAGQGAVGVETRQPSNSAGVLGCSHKLDNLPEPQFPIYKGRQ